jgi:DNA-binding XRE family transcriptional regulator
MSTFVNQLKGEIVRIAKKEVRGEIKQLKQASSKYRGEIATLKRQVASLETAITKLSKAQPKTPKVETSSTHGNLRFRAPGFMTLRKKLGLTAEQMGKLIGVSAQSVYHWEQGKSRPRATQLPAIAAVRKMGKKAALIKLGK